MSTTTDVQAHLDTTRQDIHETAAQLVGHLGMTAVSFLAGAKDRKQALRWAKAGGAVPRDPARQRLLLAHTIWSSISTVEDGYVARNWFIGCNPRLGDRSPLEALRDGDLINVAAAARAFLDRTDG